MRNRFYLLFVLLFFVVIFPRSLEIERDEIMITVNVWGQVQNPGEYKIPYNSNLIQAISKAGGYNDYADIGKIRIIRFENGEKTIIRVNLKKAFKDNERFEIPVLKHQDVIMVSKNIRKDWMNFVTFASQLAIIINIFYLISSK